MLADDVLDQIYHQVIARLQESFITQPDVLANIVLVSRSIANRACVRVILACSLAKLLNDEFDIRKPYTEIGDKDAFSGRSYDERYISAFVNKYQLPCNPTTAFLTPAFRNRNTVLTPEMNLSGRPKEVYSALLQLLTDVSEKRITAGELLSETVRQLILFRDENQQRLASLVANLKSVRSSVSLSAEQIITIIEQHLATKGASRLPVLVVAAAYTAVSSYIQEKVLPLEAHNAADSQTQAVGDVQITLNAGDNVVTCYEMKMKQVTLGDIDLAIQEKLARSQHLIENYIFITTDIITPEVDEYAKSKYDEIGIEIVVLDCISFLRHFLHLFYRNRMTFLEAYQEFVLVEPESAVSQPLKEVFLTLRLAAESNQAQ
ncbi:MAG: DNA methyltransferase [bacterium]|nr:DNA methyltransferase [bacterium]